MKLITIQKYIDTCDCGISTPVIGVGSDNKKYIVKSSFSIGTFGNGDVRDIFNEVFCYTLANELGIPVPNWALIKDGTKFKFGSEYIKGKTLCKNLVPIDNVENRDKALSIIFFQYFLKNLDGLYNSNNFIIDENNSMYCLDFNTIIEDGIWWSYVNNINMKNDLKVLLYRAGNHKWIHAYKCYDWLAPAVNQNEVDLELKKIKAIYLKLNIAKMANEINKSLMVPSVELQSFVDYFSFHQQNLDEFVAMVKMCIESNEFHEKAVDISRVRKM